MNKSLIFGMMACLMLVPFAAADGGSLDVGGYARVDYGAYANADYSGAVNAAQDAKSQVEGRVTSTIDAAMDAKGELEAKAHKKVQAGSEATVEAKTDLLDSIQANLQAFGSWVKSLWVKPSADVRTNLDGAAQHALEAKDGTIRGDASGALTSALEATAQVDYDLPPPPKPQVGFIASLKAAFEGFLSIE